VNNARTVFKPLKYLLAQSYLLYCIHQSNELKCEIEQKLGAHPDPLEQPLITTRVTIYLSKFIDANW